MDKTMSMTIATPEGIVFDGKVESAKFPGASGAFMVLPRHLSQCGLRIACKEIVHQLVGYHTH